MQQAVKVCHPKGKPHDAHTIISLCGFKNSFCLFLAMWLAVARLHWYPHVPLFAVLLEQFDTNLV